MIAIIPARGGSKGLPGKNIRTLLGKPLIAYTIEAAMDSEHVERVIVSTDDKDIAKVAIKYGAEVPFLRPKKLAGDKSLAIDNYIYTIDRLVADFCFEISDFVVLQPTSPLRKSMDIDGAITLYLERNADSVISYTEEHHPVTWHKYLNSDFSLSNMFKEDIRNRQEYRVSYFPNGAIYVFSVELIKRKQYYSEKTYAYVMPRKRSIDIDFLEDFEYVEFLMSKQKLT